MLEASLLVATVFVALVLVGPLVGLHQARFRNTKWFCCLMVTDSQDKVQYVTQDGTAKGSDAACVALDRWVETQNGKWKVVVPVEKFVL